jgi:hypothetical protein
MGAPAGSSPAGPSFFVTSSNPGRAGDLGGLAGADAHCQRLAANAGLGNRNWRAYLSTQAEGGAAAVKARDRIGKGPWTNTKGVVIANDLAQLHGTNNHRKETALTETGAVAPASPDPVNKHDILTGARPDGTAMPRAATRPAGTGPAAVRAAPWSATITAAGPIRTRSPTSHGTHRTSRRAAACRRWNGWAAPDCSIASRRAEGIGR